MTEIRYSLPIFLGIILIILFTVNYFNFFKKSVILVGRNFKKTNTVYRFIVYFIGLISFFLISYSATMPRKELKTIPGEIEVNDIFIVMDLSRSMLAEDIKPNRLEVAKEKLREFARLRPTDRIGVITFAEKVFTLLPLTIDPKLIFEVISEIDIGPLGSGTNIGDALALAVARLQDTKTKNKVIVLLTDGVNNVGNMTPIAAAEVAKNYGIKIYTITLGTDEDAKLPVGKSFFGTQYQVIPGGSYDLKTMKEVSDLTGGKTYMAQSSEALEEILSDIQKLEKTKINSHSQVIYEELYFTYLLWGVIFLVMYEFLRRKFLKEVV